MRRHTLRATVLTAATLVIAPALVPAGAGPILNFPTPLVIRVLSNRADLISGGDALVSVDYPRGYHAPNIRVSANGRDVSRAFATRPNGRYEALITGLPNGRVRLVATGPLVRGAQIVVTNHPIGGPVFAGPQVQPWVCQEGAVDKQCNMPTAYELVYAPAIGGGSFGAPGIYSAGSFQPYDPANPPPDGTIAEVTTDQGVTVPYIVRVETGYLARDQYKIATLFDPEQPWAPWAAQKQWNHKVLITHGASCGNDHTTGESPDVLNDAGLSRGFIVMSTAADNAGHNCNIVTQAESLVMAKERVVEGYGEVRYTIGTGCSGGSLTQQQVANAYPGLYQGILPACSFPDAWSTGQQLEDYVLVRRYTEDPSKWGLGVVWTPLEVAAIEGHPNHLNSIELSTLYGPLPNPAAPCAGVTPEEQWSESNPKGVRCSMQDFMVNLFGRRPQDGYAGMAYDNVGVMYGLDALKSGRITIDQFVDLNVKVGSHNINYQWQDGRLAADRFALQHAYQGGAFNETNNMDQVAIIDLRGPDPGAFHDAYRAYTVRARLDREHGHHGNHVIWLGFAPITGDGQYATQGLVAIDRWLARVEADKSSLPYAQKLVRDKPSDIVDQCSDGIGQVLPSMLPCQLVVQSYTTPRMVAGSPITTDITKCHLKKLVRSDFFPVNFLDEQWNALAQVYPNGVCDFSKKGVDQQRTRPWQTYKNGPGTGHPLGAAPVSTPL